MDDIELLYANLDGIEMSFHGEMSEETVAALESARAQAEAMAEDQPAQLGRVAVMVGQTGAKGGYRYRWTTGEDGETWFLKAPSDRKDKWDLRVSVNSAAFPQIGMDPALEGIREHIDDRLMEFGWTPTKCDKSGKFESPGRVDFCCDFLAPGFILDPAEITSKAGKEAHYEVKTHWAGRTCTSVTVGKMPNRQVIIYDKAREVVAKRKDYWWGIWGLGKENKPPVWRVELRAGGRFLKETWGIKTWEAMVEALPDLLAECAEKTRLILLTDSNVTRCPDAPLWEKVKEGIAAAFRYVRHGIAPNSIKATVRERFDVTMRQMLRGIALTHAAVMKGKAAPSEITAHIRSIAEGVIREIQNDPEDALKHAKKARSRYQLLEVEEWQDRRNRITAAFKGATGLHAAPAT